MNKIVSAIAVLALFAFIAVPANAQGIYQGGSYEPGLVPYRGQSLGPLGIQRPPVYYRGHGYIGGYNVQRSAHASSMLARRYEHTTRWCHDWVMQGGVKVYTGHAHRC